MSTLAKRIISSAVLLPLLVLFILIFPQYDMIGFVFFFTVAFAMGIHEMYTIVKRKVNISKLSYLAILLPISEYISRHMGEESLISFHIFAAIVILTFAVEVFRGAADDFHKSIERVAGTTLVFLYPGLLSTFVIDMAFIPTSTAYIFLYLIFVFSSDTFAFFVGMLFGRGNQGYVKVSPKKSIAGYIGGSFIPAIIGALAPVVFPSYFAFSPFIGFFLGLFTAIFAELGDLVESLFKRSAGVKDSGTAIPGRGGVLDSVDSLMLAAPAFITLLRVVEII